MPAKKISADRVGLPQFTGSDEASAASHPQEPSDGGAEVFTLSSHARAREALAFGLSVGAPGFNIFVLGEDRSGRMTATLSYLEKAMADRPVPDDWVYLNNFAEPHRPRAYGLPAGMGRNLRTRMANLLPRLREALSGAFTAGDYEAQVQAAQQDAQSQVGAEIDALRKDAKSKGLDLVQTAGGITVTPVGPDGNPINPAEIAEAQKEAVETALQEINKRLRAINRMAGERQMDLAEALRDLNRAVADRAIGGLLDSLAEAFEGQSDLAAWIESLREDILANVRLFMGEAAAPSSADGQGGMTGAAESLLAQRYGVNLLIDNGDAAHPEVVLEANPTAGSLFGDMEYRQAGGVLETDFTLIRAGALHRANGGILVLRAETLAADPAIWLGLKAALRDRQVVVGQLSRRGGVPIAGAPQPLPVPLDVKVVLVGAPRWYYTFFSVDPDFHHYFRIKADVDTDMPADESNLACYRDLVQEIAARNCGRRCTAETVDYILGLASRWAGDRTRLTAQFEQVEDAVQEATLLMGECGDGDDPTAPLYKAVVVQAIARRRDRNARIEDRLYEQIADDMVMIDVTGSVRGQINALTVRSFGDHSFGTPSRVTARASVGRRGVINVERDIALGGPIQQKGVMVLQGFLAGHFARRHPLSFNCSITFEQSYGGVEGDSASLAELVAILSDISGLPARQDLAITGSVNQRGQSQVVGGVHHKVEGFFRACRDKGRLTGTQGVIIPRANETNLVLDDEVAQAAQEGNFTIWSVETIDEALELFLGTKAGEPDQDGNYPPDSIYGRVAAELAAFNDILSEDR
ncbi:MAG: AAA family ATPase [Pseudomonadota bacterium]